MRGLRRTGHRVVRDAIASRAARLRRLCRRWEITLRQGILAVLLPLAGLLQQGMVVRLEGPSPFANPQAITITVEMTGVAGRMTLSLKWTRPGGPGALSGEGGTPLMPAWAALEERSMKSMKGCMKDMKNFNTNCNGNFN